MVIVVRPQGLIVEQNIEKISTKKLSDIIGCDYGYVEQVPYFNSYGRKRCRAFCDEEGKRKNLSTNSQATGLWHAQKKEVYHKDFLRGTVVIVTTGTKIE